MGYVSDAKYQPLPAIILKGHWLEQVGFETGTPLEVRVLPDCLILTVKPPPESEVIKALRKACKLPARKQRQIAEFIEVIAGPQKRTAKA